VQRVQGDVLAPETLRAALEGVDVAFYLIHSLTTGVGFEQTEERAARNFASAAAAAGVSRIVYLGGMAPAGTPLAELSPHLRSRVRVGQVLRESGIPAVELRAAVVIGSGSASFEMLRYLTERLPVMVTPRWVGTRIQPIAVRDVLRYLVGSAGAADGVVGAGGVYDIGGPDVLTYREMITGSRSWLRRGRRDPLNALRGRQVQRIQLVQPRRRVPGRAALDREPIAVTVLGVPVTAPALAPDPATCTRSATSGCRAW
jgi:uncharacterized protein YbjT (DUF2867 family)